MARLGVCLEPMMCFLIHKIPSENAPAQMTAQAKAFNPFAAAGASQASSFQVKEFKPQTATEEKSMTAQSGIISMLSRMGLEAQVD